MTEPLSNIDMSIGHATEGLTGFLTKGGPALWAIAALSVLALALILWKTWRFMQHGIFQGGERSAKAARLWRQGDRSQALSLVEGQRSLRAQLAMAAMRVSQDPTFDQQASEAEAGRVARGLLTESRSGLRALELIATIAPLLGLLGTVLGMITAFQALQEAGTRADPAVLAGGIWEALLTTAAGMAVAIVAVIALVWFESIVDRLRHDMEDAATQILLYSSDDDASGTKSDMQAAAE